MARRTNQEVREYTGSQVGEEWAAVYAERVDINLGKG